MLSSVDLCAVSWSPGCGPAPTTTTLPQRVLSGGMTGAEARRAIETHGLGLPVVPILLALGGLALIALTLIGIASLGHRRQTKADLLQWGMYGVTGRMGGGKSYFLALAAYGALQRGRAVYANYNLRGAQRVRSWKDVLDVPEGSLIIVDEVHLWWPSEAFRCPPEIMAFCSQVRKNRYTLLWATQHEEFTAKRLRRLTLGFWLCKKYRQGHQYTLYDAVGYQTGKKLPGERLARMNIIRKKEVMALYDTTEFVEGSVEWGDGRGYEALGIGSDDDRSDRTAPPSVSGGPAGPDGINGSEPGSIVVAGRSFSRSASWGSAEAFQP